MVWGCAGGLRARVAAALRRRAALRPPTLRPDGLTVFADPRAERAHRPAARVRPRVTRRAFLRWGSDVGGLVACARPGCAYPELASSKLHNFPVTPFNKEGSFQPPERTPKRLAIENSQKLHHSDTFSAPLPFARIPYAPGPANSNNQ
jgi:hypothetical protein